jgi:hypothetical protein
MEVCTMNRNLKVIIPHEPKPTQAPSRRYYNAITHAKSSNQIRWLNFGRFNFRYKCHLGFHGHIFGLPRSFPIPWQFHPRAFMALEALCDFVADVPASGRKGDPLTALHYTGISGITKDCVIGWALMGSGQRRTELQSMLCFFFPSNARKIWIGVGDLGSGGDDGIGNWSAREVVDWEGGVTSKLEQISGNSGRRSLAKGRSAEQQQGYVAEFSSWF